MGLSHCLEILRTHTDFEIQSNHDQKPILSCSNLMRCYGIVASMLLKSDGALAYPKTHEDLRARFPKFHRSVVTHYDHWRYDALYEFAEQLVQR